MTTHKSMRTIMAAAPLLASTLPLPVAFVRASDGWPSPRRKEQASCGNS
jgi:hypothetical protein